jgi:hypothetical protein
VPFRNEALIHLVLHSLSATLEDGGVGDIGVEMVGEKFFWHKIQT